jgi:hypothetical protein
VGNLVTANVAFIETCKEQPLVERAYGPMEGPLGWQESVLAAVEMATVVGEEKKKEEEEEKVTQEPREQGV